MRKTAFLYIVIASILWGTSGIFFKWLKPYGFSPIQMTAVRGVISALAMVVYLLLFNRKLLKFSKKDFFILLGSGISLFGTAGCYYFSINASSVSTAVILMYTAPVFVMIYSVIFLGEKFNKLKLLAIVLMIVGCALVSGVIGGMKFGFWGIAFGLASGISYSAYNIFTKIQAIKKVNSITATFYSFVIMGFISLCASNPVQMVNITMQKPLPIIALMLCTGIFSCTLPYLLYSYALKFVPAGTASALSIIEPMAATVLSIIFFEEVLGVPTLCGIVLILLAVFALNRNE